MKKRTYKRAYIWGIAGAWGELPAGSLGGKDNGGGRSLSSGLE
ncbi:MULTISPECIES: hypothetical protein [unclassified Bartonella]